jgi:hypothetical protein
MERSIVREASATPACQLNVFDEEQQRRHEELQMRFASVVEEKRELPNGYTFRLVADAGAFVGVAEWITLDRLCCPFLDFRLEWKGGGPWLSLTGDNGVKEMLDAALSAAR